VEVDGGVSTSFWFNKWLPARPLVERFPALLSHCTRLQVTAAKVTTNDLELQPRLSAVVEHELSLVCQIIDHVELTIGQDRRYIDSPSAPPSARDRHTTCSRRLARPTPPPA
jgi:hypothetical protein